MTRKELRQDLIEILGTYLSEKGFKIDADNTIYKKTKTHTFSVGLEILTYDTIWVNSLFPFIQFNEIEKPLISICYFDKSASESKMALKNSMTVKGDWVREYTDFGLSMYTHSVLFSEILKEYLEKVAFPFFDKYSNLQEINQEILANDMPYKEGIGYIGDMQDYFKIPIVGGDTRSKLRRMFIMKYCNDSRYDDFLKWYQNHLDVHEVNTNEVLRLKLYKFFNDTKEYLANLKID